MLNPVLLFDWVNSGTTYLFSDVPDVPGAIVLIDHNLAVAPTITGNRVTASGGGTGDSAFAIQIKGRYSRLAFQGQANNSGSDGFTMVIPNHPVIAVSTAATVDPVTGIKGRAVPGAEVVHTADISNLGGAASNSNTVFFVSSLSAGQALFTGDLGAAGSGPVALTTLNGAGVTLTPSASSGVRYSAAAAPPASFAACDYVPSGSFDPAVRHVCVQLAGALAAGDPDPVARLTYRVRIE